MGEQGKRAFVMGLVLCEKAQAGLFSLLSLQVCEQWREQIVRRLYDVGFLERRKSVYFRQHCTFARVLTCVFHTKPSIGKPRRMLGPALEHHHGHVIGFFLIAETDVYEAFVDPGSGMIRILCFRLLECFGCVAVIALLEGKLGSFCKQMGQLLRAWHVLLRWRRFGEHGLCNRKCQGPITNALGQVKAKFLRLVCQWTVT